jgi:hypothetical protein
MLFGAFIINVEISTNRLTRTSQKIGTHPTIRYAIHDISPGLENQVIHELECWIRAVEFFKFHPSHVSYCLPGPTDQKFLMIVRQSALDHFGRLQASASMTDRGQNLEAGWRLAVEFLE